MAAGAFVPDAAGMAYLKSWAGPVGRRLETESRGLQVKAKRTVGVDLGFLQSSIRFDRDIYRGNLEARIGSGKDYARLHHEGTRPHVIRARRARYLRFRVNGRIIYRKQVFHPGTRPNPYLTKYLREAATWR